MLIASARMVRDRRQWPRHLAGPRLTYVIAVLLTAALQLPVAASGVLAADYQGTLRIGGTGAAAATINQVAAAFQKKHPGSGLRFLPASAAPAASKRLSPGPWMWG